ncbi:MULTISPECIES: SDR family oxidoreductase [unclassified Rhodococcus (in: high G+C Gram-positive bacteria)]|uniref:SDR family oxidoreductase n=1 Tax=unclassified Rhodococcus (in: high G+C Gram-positive bacteria) TaxID=192944 RepID=UPI00163AB639|nr:MULTISPECIES: NmrA family NAD(P)-binding protein [unclassified Rhodococcus (in: high G+C Gram-positive bacteria)]MBC2637760.1 NmrA family NAD(P)-binding protein [Rhodococcus sp. 3A]MBC2897495.1 NmrA family NAD(P)-binding protein [Rhodococcus sp. 4CII]
MTILVLGGTGRVGTHLVRNLTSQNETVRVLVHNPDRAALVPDAAEVFVANILEDPNGARAAFGGVESVFMLNAATDHETVEGLLVLSMARAAGVKRFVYQSTHSLAHLHHIPHLGAKLAIEAALKSSGLDYTIISPNFFFQADEDCRYAMLQHGFYLNPVGDVGCWRVDVRDIAEAAAKVLTSDGHSGRNYALIGPENLTGPQCAEKWSRALGQPVRYEGDINVWEASMEPYLTSWMIEDVGAMFYEIGLHGMLGNVDELDTLTRLLGRPPRSYDDYIKESVVAWREPVS